MIVVGLISLILGVVMSDPFRMKDASIPEDEEELVTRKNPGTEE